MFEVLLLLPTWYVYTTVFLLGLIMGSFLDVVALRMHTGTSLHGRSRCFSCGHTLSWFELFPVLSYLWLRGRCRVCHATISVRLLLIEVLTGSLFLVAYVVSQSLIEFGLLLGVMMVLLVIGLYDLRHLIIPNELVVVLLGFALGFLLFSTNLSLDPFAYIPAVIGGLAAGGFYGSLWLISRGRWIGLGDAKLAVPLGIMLGPWSTFSFVILSFWVGAIVSICLLLVQALLVRGQRHLPFSRVPITMKSEVPFAPFMIIAFLLVYMLHANVLSLIDTLLYAFV